MSFQAQNTSWPHYRALSTALCICALVAGCSRTKEDLPSYQPVVAPERVLEMRWDRSVANLEVLLADPISASRLNELKARLRLVNDRLSDDAVRSDSAYRELLARRLETINMERGGTIDGDPQQYEALQRRLDGEAWAIRRELRRLDGDHH